VGVCLGSSSLLTANIINVYSLTQLEDAIDMAKPDDTIKIHRTIRLTRSPIIIENKSLSLDGGEEKSTLIAIGGQTRILEIKGNGTEKVLIKNLTIENGSPSQFTKFHPDFGGGILNDGALLELLNVDLIENDAINGGGIANMSGSIDLKNCKVKNNRANQMGGGIFNNGKMSITDNSHVNQNKCLNGGGIYNNGDLSITSSTVNHNRTRDGGKGGGIFNDIRANTTLASSFVENNQADNGVILLGGGIFNSGKMSITDNSHVNENKCLNGGGIYNNGDLSITSSKVKHNTTIDGGQGGGIFNDIKANTTLTSSFVEHNQADNGVILLGGGISNAGQMTIENSVIKDNQAKGGGGIYNNGTTLLTNQTKVNDNKVTLYGGGIYNDFTGILRIEFSHVNNNRIDNPTGGGGFLISQGGGILNGNSLLVISSTVNDNIAGKEESRALGGGICNLRTTILQESEVMRNKAGLGGGIYNSIGLTIDEMTRVEKNKPQDIFPPQ
jgi:hypothetical protein